MSGLAQQAAEIFDAVAALADTAERSAYLSAACGQNQTLRGEVEQLLQHDQAAGSFLEQPAAHLDAIAPPETPGTMIGPYKLLEQIGEGGMGLVFVAEQQQPIKRRVALKIIKPGMDSRQVIARFEAERQALAMMEHPNIARVYDGGTTGTVASCQLPVVREEGSQPLLTTDNLQLATAGRPYFVMELVKGTPITEYCDQHKLTTRQRLELFLDVCHAVQHAHQKGIIHRDIKPSNVLVSLHDTTPVVKVIDFGIAKATSGQLTDKTIYTQFTQMLGTPLYMSPEQAGLSDLDVDTRSDVYSLGVLLYELLTGTTPFDDEALKKAGYDEMRRIIREDEPPRPSARLSTMQQAHLSTIAEKRGLEPHHLRKHLRGELDWIVMRALEKDRNRRYESASAFAADLERYLRDEPVQACPPSQVYLLRKFARRHRVGLVVAGCVLTTLVFGSLAMWRDVEERAAIREKERADEKAEEALRQKQLALENKSEAERQRARAQWQVYLRQIALAQREWEAGNVAQARDLLNSCRADFRGWEFNYLHTLFNSNQRTLLGHSARIAGVAFSPDGKRIVSGGYDQTVRVWDVPTGQQLLLLQGQAGKVLSVAYSHDGQWIASGSADGTIRLWNARSGQQARILEGHSLGISSIAFSPDGKRIVSGGLDTKDSFKSGEVKVWDTHTGEETLCLKGHAGGVHGVAFSPDGKQIASASWDRTVRIWDAQAGRPMRTLKGHDDAINCVAFSPDRQHLLSGSMDGTLKLWDAQSGLEVRSFTADRGEVCAAAFSPDGRHIVSGGNDQSLRVWDAQTGQLANTLKGHTAAIYGVAFSPDGRSIASGGLDGSLKIWDAETKQGSRALRGHAGVVAHVEFSPDGKRIVSGSWDQTLKLWDALTGTEIRAFKGHAGWVRSVAFSPDGKRLASASSDQTVILWDAATGHAIRSLHGHSGIVHCVAFSPNGKRLASGGLDEMLKLWDATTGLETLSCFVETLLRAQLQGA